MLIEVMVSVLIFAVGVLALVSLQAAMTHAQTEAKVRADAANLASEVVGMMWADANNLAGYATASCASTPQCAGWKNKVLVTLPQGSVQITTDAATGRVAITLGWTLPNGDPHTYSTATTVTLNPP
jgi:type IV pilus assembly protein PilV